jgi:hypothetical protein
MTKITKTLLVLLALRVKKISNTEFGELRGEGFYLFCLTFPFLPALRV